MPTAIKMQKELEGEFHTILVESQGSSQDKVDKLALERMWLGSSAMWTDERPVVTNAKGIPNFVLLSSDGEVVLMGNPISMHGQIEDYIKGEKRRGKRAPDSVPAALQPAWKAMQRGKFADAVASIEKDGAQSEEAAAMLALVNGRAESLVKRAAGLIEAGQYSRAEDMLEDLKKSLAGHDLAARVAELQAELASDELAEEIKAESKLAKLTKKLFESGPDKGAKKRLESLASKHEGTKAAARATHLASLIES